MKKSITLLVLLWQIQTCLLHAQVHDRVLSFGFNTEPHELLALGDGRWLTIARGEPVPGGAFADTVIALVFNSKGEILLRRHLNLPQAEVYRIQSATATPDGGFAVSIAEDLCDAGFDNYDLFVFAPDGALRWSKFSTATEKQPYLLKIAPDGNLVGAVLNQIIKYSIGTGQILWKTSLNPPSDFPDIYDFGFYPGTEHIVAVGSPDLQFWEQTGTPEAPAYNLTYSRNITPFVFFNRIIAGPGKDFYTFYRNEGRLFVFDGSSLDYFEVADFPFAVYDLEATVTGLYLLAFDKEHETSLILRAGGDGQITDTLLSSRWQTGFEIAWQNDTLAVAGVSGSGPPWAEPSWLPYNARHLWLHTRPLLGGTPEPEVNAALTGVEQGEPLLVSPSPYNPWSFGKRYNFSGGNFRVQVSNTGTTLLDQVDVQIAFDWDDGSHCIIRPVYRRRYADLGLAPGASVWLDFGDITANYQLIVPVQFCFWTSAPNERPDANHDDDVFCHTAVVSTEAPEAGGFSVAPNPASNGCWLTLPGHKQTVGRVFDFTGQLVQQIELPTGNTRFYLDTGEWATGIYVLQIENWCGKIIVQH